MNKIIIALIALTLVASPVLACERGDPLCYTGKPVATINTYFTNTGPYASFSDGTWINPIDSSGLYYSGVIENVIADGSSTLNVGLSSDFSQKFGIVNLNQDKVVSWTTSTPWTSDLDVNNEVWWNGKAAQDYRTVSVNNGQIYADINTLAVGAHSTGTTIDNIDIDHATSATVYQSVGLNRYSTCGDIPTPVIPTPPVCQFCARVS